MCNRIFLFKQICLYGGGGAIILKRFTRTALLASTRIASSTADADWHIVRFWCCLLHIDLFAGDDLLWSFQQFIDHLFRIECDETEAFALILLFVKWHFNFNDLNGCKLSVKNDVKRWTHLEASIGRAYISKLSEECFDFIVADFCGESTDKDFAMACFGLFRIHFLVVDDVLAHRCHFID